MMDFATILDNDLSDDSIGLQLSNDMYKESFLRWFDKFKEYHIPKDTKKKDIYTYHNINEVEKSPRLKCVSWDQIILFPVTILHQCPCDIDVLTSNFDSDSYVLNIFSTIVDEDGSFSLYAVTADDIKVFKRIKLDKVNHVICSCVFSSDKVALDFINYIINDLKLELSLHYQTKILRYTNGPSAKNISDFIEQYSLFDKVKILFQIHNSSFDYYSIQNNSTILDE